MSCQQNSKFQNTYGTAPGNFAVWLLSNNVLLCQTSWASRQRHRWSLDDIVTAGTATAARAGFFGVNTHSSSSLSDLESVTSGRGDGDCWPAASMVLVASRGRRWCWWLAGVVSCGTATSVVLVASWGRRWCWWLAGSSVVVPGVGGVGGWPSSSGLSAAVWAVVTQPAVASGSSAHPALAAPKL